MTPEEFPNFVKQVYVSIPTAKEIRVEGKNGKIIVCLRVFETTLWSVQYL